MLRLINCSAILFLLFELANGQGSTYKRLDLRTVDYQIDYRIDYKESKLYGNCRLAIYNPTSLPINAIPLLLYRTLKVRSIIDSIGQAIPYTQQVVSFVDFEQLQVNYVNVSVPNRLDGHKRLVLNIQYDGYLMGYSETGMEYIKDNINEQFTILRPDAYAYPVVGYPSWELNRQTALQQFNYRVRVAIPSSLVAANGGRLTEKITSDSTTTYTYSNIKPAWRIDIAISNYGILQSDKNKIFYFHQDSVGAKRVKSAFDSAVKVFTGWFGSLEDYQGYSIIEIPSDWGSQNDVTSIIQTADAFNDEKQIFQLYHEVSHQWNVQSLDPDPSRFESEGLAMFLQYRMVERLEHNEGELKRQVEKAIFKLKKHFTDNVKYANTPMIDYGKEQMTSLSYSKGMILFDILYEMMGDKTFDDAIRLFYKDYYRIGATSVEFVNLLKNMSKADLTNVFDDWLYGTKSSKYILDGVSIDKMISLYGKAK